MNLTTVIATHLTQCRPINPTNQIMTGYIMIVFLLATYIIYFKGVKMYYEKLNKEAICWLVGVFIAILPLLIYYTAVIYYGYINLYK